MSVRPAVSHHGMGTIDTGCIAVGCYLNLNPVQGWTANFVQLSFDPFKHVSHDPCPMVTPYTELTNYTDELIWPNSFSINPKFEYRNPKQYQMTKMQNSKQY